ncbi:MAG: dTMP kinase [Candidatus Helarchaeota archaeon]
MQKGKFIVLDGIDGVGTTTHSQALKAWLEKQGYAVIWTQEPTNRRIGSLIQKLIKSDKTSPITDALLFAADRNDHTENIIKPALAADKIVISDRYVEASIAYQTAAGVDMSWILELNKFVTQPDLTIILDIKPEIGLQRKTKLEDKFENAAFLYKVRNIYLQRAKMQQYPIINTNRSISQVQTEIQELIRSIL